MDADPFEPDPGSPSSEFGAIDRWTSSLPTSGPAVLTGPGDDVAWLKADGPIALSTDTMVEGVHFRRSWCEPEDIGWRLLAAALSDLAASRARPLGFLLALSVPRLDGWVDGVVAGVAEAARAWSVPALGGDTTGSPGPAMLNATVLGAPAPTPLHRAGAADGELVQLSGLVGAMAWATERLLLGEDIPWPRPRARLDLLDALADATAGIDISDGLIADAGHVARASGVDLVLDPERVAAQGVPRSYALTGGEDYELLVTAPAPLPGFVVIGRVEAGPGVVRLADGSPLPDGPGGWDHGDDPC
jgi:thiamine-monophosphate kinase